MTALLQVALDVVSLREAIRIARLSVKGGADILEAGTPLIKSVGLISVEVLKEAFPEKIVVADLKTMDAGRLEASLAFEKGADIVTVMALATMETITEVVETAREYGGKVMVDLMNVSNPFLEAKKLSVTGVDYFCLHVGIDVQRRRKITAEQLVNEAERLKEEGFKVAVAGGLNEKTVQSFRNMDIVIVGSRITKSSKPDLVTSLIKKILSR